MYKKTIIATCFLLAALFFFLPQKEEEFSLSSAALYSHQAWDLQAVTSQEEQEIRAALSQKFTYCGCGAQVYVFFSEDGSFVIKLFKKKKFEVPLWIRFLPPNPYKTRKLNSKRAKMAREFLSYQIAFNELKQETALLFVHLDKKIDQKVTLVTEALPHEVNIGEYAFILQRKGEQVYPSVEKMVQEGDLNGAKQALTSLIELLKNRCAKGVDDTHPNFEKNFAFIGGEAVQIDLGRFTHSDVKVPQISKSFKAWLHNLSPELHADFESTYNLFFINSFAECSSEKKSCHKPKSKQRKS